MFSKKLLGHLALSFGAGFIVARELSDEPISFGFIRRHHAATIQNHPAALVPYSAPLKPAVDDLALNKSTRTSDIMRHGYPSLDNLRVYDDFVISYDRRNRVPNWVFEHLNSEKLKSFEDADRGKSDFKEDPLIHPYFRSKNDDYKGSGYDRGHMAAASNHRNTQRIMDQTFFLTNIAPQVCIGFSILD